VNAILPVRIKKYGKYFDYLSLPRFHANLILSMRSTRPQWLIWDGSISENVRLRDVINLTKFHAFIKKGTILSFFGR